MSFRYRRRSVLGAALGRALIIVVAATALSGCIIVTEHPRRPFYY